MWLWIFTNRDTITYLFTTEALRFIERLSVCYTPTYVWKRTIREVPVRQKWYDTFGVFIGDQMVQNHGHLSDPTGLSTFRGSLFLCLDNHNSLRVTPLDSLNSPSPHCPTTWARRRYFSSGGSVSTTNRVETWRDHLLCVIHNKEEVKVMRLGKSFTCLG